MPPKKRIEATVYIVDCSTDVEERLRYLHKIFCLQMCIQTKGVEKDIQRIVLYNHPNLQSRHKVNDWRTYTIDNLREMKKQIKEACEIPKKPLNFLYSIKYAIDDFNTDLIKAHYVKRIIFLTDLSSNMEFNEGKLQTQIGLVNELLESKSMWVYIIGVKVKIPRLREKSEIPKLSKFEVLDNLSQQQKINYDLMSKLNNTVFVDFVHGIDIIFSHHVNRKPAFITYYKLNIGTNIHIPVMINKTTIKTKSFVKCGRCPLIHGKVLCRKKLWFDVNTHQKVPPEHRVKGYKLHKKFVHISDEQITNARKVHTEKCLTIIGFAKAEEVPIKFYAKPYSLHRVNPDKRGPSCERGLLELLIESMRMRNVVALGYKVFRKGCKRQLVCMYPCRTHKTCNHLFLVELYFEHELRERVIEGKIEETNYESDTYSLMSAFLDKLVPFDTETEQELFPLSRQLCVCRSRLRSAEVLGYKALKEEIGEPPKLEMHPLLVTRASNSVKDLIKHLIEN